MSAPSSCWRSPSRCSRCSCATSICGGVLARDRPRAAGMAGAVAGDDVRQSGDPRLRWQYLLEPLGETSFVQCVSRDGRRVRGEQRAAGARRRGHSPVFPRRATSGMSATGAFATIILERLLDTRDGARPARVLRLRLRPAISQPPNPVGVRAGEVGRRDRRRRSRSPRSCVLFVLAGDPARLGRTLTRLERVMPSALAGADRARRREVRARARRHPAARAGCWSRSPGRFRCGCRSPSASGRSPSRFSFDVPFTGSFLMRRAARARRGRADARRGRRISRGVPHRRDDVLRRAG